MSKSVLIIDDDPFIHKLVRRAIEPAGFECRTAEDGESGIALALESQPDVILLDVEMPGTNGYEVCEKLKELESTRDVSVVFLSSHTSLQKRMQGYEVGADDYLTKPFEKEHLIARLDVLSNYQRDRKELREQYRLAQATAKIAISGTSEIGLAIHYVEKSITFSTVSETMEGLLDTTDRLALECCLRLETASGVLMFASEGTISPLEAELLDLSREKRFVDFGCRTLIHFDDITLLIKNMPLDNMERYGRIKDLVPLLLSAAQTKCRALHTHQALVDQSDDLKSSFSSIRKNLYELAAMIVDSREKSEALIATTIRELNVDMISLGLEPQQESYLLGRIESSILESLDELNVGPQLKDSFSFILRSLEETMAKHECLLEAFIASQTKNLHEGDEGGGEDIELF